MTFKSDTLENDHTSENLPKNWREILEYGRYAPSPHNMQPWLFRVDSEDTVTLLYDPKRLLPGTNPLGSYMQVGFGILNETLSIAAAPLGLDVKATYQCAHLDPAAEGPQVLATLKLVKRKKHEILSRQLIIDRRTSRLEYDGQPVKNELMQELAEIAQSYGHQFEYSHDPKEVKWTLRLNSDAMFSDMSQPISRDEVASWMRFSVQDAKKRKDGLAAYTMNSSGFLMWLFVRFNWFFRLPIIYPIVRSVYEKTMSGTATVAWLTGPFKTQEDWENAGKMMARMWLTMTKHGVYLHPFGSVITNPKAHETMLEHFKDRQSPGDLWMLMRMGHSKTPPQAQRMPLSSMLVEKSLFNKQAPWVRPLETSVRPNLTCG